MPPQIPLAFQQGSYRNNEGIVIPIQQLMIFHNGDAVVARDTNVAKAILSDYLSKLDTELGYRNEGNIIKTLYINNMVVELSRDIDDLLPDVGKVSDILTKQIDRDQKPFMAKRLMFGFGDPIAGNLDSLEAIEAADFVIEVRAGESRERHRYFTSAPVETAEHIRILEMIEAGQVEKQ
jgi:hypothetical protein